MNNAKPALPEPVGYLPAYELDRMRSGHSGNARSAKFGASKLDGDVAIFTADQLLAAARAAAPRRNFLRKKEMIETRTVTATWQDVLRESRPAGPLTALLLWFRPWIEIKCPNEWPHELSDGSGSALYRYKTLFGYTYHLSQSPSPGFSGS